MVMEEMLFEVFLFLALDIIFRSGVKDLSNFGRTSQGIILSSLTEIGQGVLEEMLVEEFNICSSDHHFVHRSGTVCAIFVGNFLRNNSIKFD